MENTVKSRRASGWHQEETERLMSAVREANAAGLPLRSVFEDMSSQLGRKSNSIRNHYYACIREHPDAQVLRNSPTRPFTPEETHELLRRVLMARAQGTSVRACVMAMAEGDHSRMLRYQNKYRTMLRQHPEMIASICQELQTEGLPCPVMPAPETADPAFCDPEDAAAAKLMAEPCIASLLEGLKDLLRRAARAEDAQDYLHQLDRLKVEHDLQRIMWEKDFAEATQYLASCLSLLREVAAMQPGAVPEEGFALLTAAEGFLTRMEG